MSRVLTAEERRNVVAVGHPASIATEYWNAWRPAIHELKPPAVDKWVASYFKGVQESVQQHLGRRLITIGGAEVMWEFLSHIRTSHGTEQNSFPAEMARSVLNLSRVVFNIQGEVSRLFTKVDDYVDLHSDQIFIPTRDATIDFSRGKYPRLKSTDSASRIRGKESISRRKPIAAQLSAATARFGNSEVWLFDDRGQTGSTLSKFCERLRGKKDDGGWAGMRPAYIIVGHAEKPRADFQSIRCGNDSIPVYCSLYNFDTQQEQDEWKSAGEAAVAVDELHDLFSSCPAAGVAVVAGYFEAFSKLRKVYGLLRDTFVSMARHVASNRELSSRKEADSFIPYSDLEKAGLVVTHPNLFTDYLMLRANEFASYINEPTGPNVKVSAANLENRFGVDDVNRIFSQSRGFAVLKDHPDFDPDFASPDYRYGNWFPFHKGNDLGIMGAFGNGEEGIFACARYSLDELDRTIVLVDQWEQQFGRLHPTKIPHLYAPEVQKLMGRKGKTTALDQLSYVRSVLQLQINERDIRPLVLMEA